METMYLVLYMRFITITYIFILFSYVLLYIHCYFFTSVQFMQ